MPVRRKGRRYLRIRVESSRGFTAKEVINSIQRGILEIHGVQGLSQIEPVLLEFDEEDQRGILRCNRDQVIEARAAIALVTAIGGTPAAMHVMRVSGTIRSLRKEVETCKE